MQEIINKKNYEDSFAQDSSSLHEDKVNRKFYLKQNRGGNGINNSVRKE